MDVVIGLDLGTQGVRAIACNGQGDEIAGARESLPHPCISERSGYSEQDPHEWEEVVFTALGKIVSNLPNGTVIRALCMDSTSGTVLPIDEAGRPLHHALLHNDVRASEEAREASVHVPGMGATFALPKILWLRKNRTDLLGKTARYLHAADYLVGLLTGDYSISDISNVMKCGFDLEEDCWPKSIEKALGVPLAMLPKVARPGEIVGKVRKESSEKTGIPQGTPVAVGATDSTAAFFASGARIPGDWSSTLGTTLALKGISRERIVDPTGVVYNHRHPEGYWLPGGASNVGGECLTILFGDGLRELDERAARKTPTDLVVYPLVRRGERLPFISPKARGFIAGDLVDRADLYTAYLEGVAYVERWVFERFSEMGLEVGDTVYASGGGAKSPVWLKIRATVLGKRFVRPKTVESAMGAAVLAASRTIHSNIAEAAQAMVHEDTTVDPDPEKQSAYDERYRRFRAECRKRDYGE